MAIKKRKVLNAAIVLGTVVSMLVACSSGNNNVNSGGATQPAEGNTAAPTETSPTNSDGKFDPPVTITTVTPHLSADTKYPEGDTMTDNFHSRWVKENLGIDLKFLWGVSNTEAYQTKQKLMLAGNEEMPDIMLVHNELISEFISSGRFMDITEAFEMYAPERLKATFENDPDLWVRVRKDGKNYGLPVLTNMETNAIMFMRQDWLDNLNLKAPTTIDELEQVLDAFTNQDPDQNGKNDTIGISLAGKDKLATWTATADFVFGAYGKMPELWYKAEDGTLQYGSINPSVKTALGKLAEWFNKGYLDKALGTLDNTKAAESFTQGKSGIYVGPSYSPNWPMKGAGMDVSVVEAYPIPKGPEGLFGSTAAAKTNHAYLFSKDFQHMDAFFKYLDIMMRPYAEDSPFYYGAEEGLDYILVDGKPVYDAPELKKPDSFGMNDYMLTFNYAIPQDNSQMYDDLLAGKEPVLPNEIMASQWPLARLKAYALDAKNKAAQGMQNAFQGQPTKTLAQKGELLLKMERETFLKIVYNELPLDAFDKFVEDWKKAGGDQVTTEVNEWYNTTK
ncbi:extracellular solute-binding protein [Paenibacillus chungangensis]|uniref:Extracellular solute-binding protein n=1 Tax=Paenibacillus chungangensis TaxID=696535 RepID=A0ABW3HW25_9BACL